MGAYRVLLGDDHALFRQGIKRLIKEIPGVEVIAEAGDGVEVLNQLKELTPDLAVLAISMPNLSGIETTREIKRLYPYTKVLILSMHKRKDCFYEAISIGAQGYLLKEDSHTELISAIETIRKGGTYVTRLFAGRLAEDLSQTYRVDGEILRGPLTPREREVLDLIADGKSNREIADLIDISMRTVEKHRANIMKKLKLRKAADLVRYAIQNEIV